MQKQLVSARSSPKNFMRLHSCEQSVDDSKMHEKPIINDIVIQTQLRQVKKDRLFGKAKEQNKALLQQTKLYKQRLLSDANRASANQGGGQHLSAFRRTVLINKSGNLAQIDPGDANLAENLFPFNKDSEENTTDGEPDAENDGNLLACD